MLGCDGAKQLTPARAGSRRLARKRPADSPRSLCGGGFGLWSTCELIGTFPELFAKDRHDGLVGFSSVSKTFHEGQSKGSKHVKTWMFLHLLREDSAAFLRQRAHAITVPKYHVSGPSTSRFTVAL